MLTIMRKSFSMKTILQNFVFINEDNKSKEIQGKNALSFTKCSGGFSPGGFCPGVFCADTIVMVIFYFSNCRYRELNVNSPSVIWLWEILESFSQEERVLFLRFISGRSLLPSNLADFSRRLQ